MNGALSARDRGVEDETPQGLALWCREVAFEGLALVGLFWAIRLWLEREDAFTRGRECEAECWSCAYQDCGHCRAPGCE